MSVTNIENALAQNLKMMAEWTMHFEATSQGATVRVLAVENAPIQYVNTTGNATIRLPLAAKNGTLWLIVNNAAVAETILVTDDAGTPVTAATLAADTSGLFQKQGAGYKCLFESAVIA